MEKSINLNDDMFVFDKYCHAGETNCTVIQVENEKNNLNYGY